MATRGGEYQRLELVFEMLHKYLERAWSDDDLAEALGTDRKNIWRIRKEVIIESLGIPVDPHPTLDGKHYLHPDYEIRHIPFNRTQMAWLYLAGRRLQQQTRTSQKDVATMLEKTARALRKPLAVSLVRTAEEVMQQEQNQAQEEIFSTLIECWIEQVPVRITHRKLRGQPRIYFVEPYQIEPSVWGDGNYLIGKSDHHKGLATFKISRIEKAIKSTGNYSIDPEFDVHDLLKHAWGVWHADEEPVTVRLRFSKWVIQRLKETIWHPSAVLHDPEKDGSCVWEVQVAEWREMAPWVRGWGADVEVLEPQQFRDHLKKQVGELARTYGIVELKPQSTKPIAHTKNANGERHDLLEHIEGVARLAEQFAEPFGAGKLGKQLGLWHDTGKFSTEFQQYLFDAENEPTRKHRGPDHKAAGARIAKEMGYPFLTLLIQGHHGGLQNKDNFESWYEEKKGKTEEAITLARQHLPAISEKPQLDIPDYIRKDQHAAEFFLRMLFSALVDADFLDTEQHFNPDKSELRSKAIAIDALWQRFEQNRRQFEKTVKDSLVNRLRREIFELSIAAAKQPTGMFRYTVPTGGGKTLSGLAFALRHAHEHGLQRVIVAVPFITITEQTANVYRRTLESEMDDASIVLEHHSGAKADFDKSVEYSADGVWNRLASENWDAPIVVTTTVQLFESLFANGTSDCRKLHRLAKSVIILDEAQSLPVGLLEPILNALRELCTHYGSTVVLSTATQPAFEVIKAFQAVEAMEIIPNPQRFFQQLSRVTYEWRLDPKPTWADVATWVQDERQVLVIVNTKKDAIALLDELDDLNVLHLSTLLCGAHRKQVVEEIKRRLQAGEPCKVVSTQVVEAGVDIDFPIVMRAFAPLDSIIQAAGRANREGLLAEKGRVIIFDPAEGGLPMGNYRIARDTTRTLLYDGPPDMDDPAVISRFFNEYYPLPNHDQHKIQALRKKLNYREVANKFRMIEDNTISVVVCYSSKQTEIECLLEDLRMDVANRRFALRQLQPFLVSIYKHQAKKYFEQGLVSAILTDDDGELILGEWRGKYDDVRGLVIQDLDADNFVF